MAFGYFTPFTINTGQVPSAQTDFPILFNTVDIRFATVANGGHVQSSSGFDIRPFSDSGLVNALSYELERYNATTGEVIMWIKRSSVSDGLVTYLGYGDSTITTDGSSGTNTFSNGFLAVWHFKDGTTLSVADSLGTYSFTTHNSPTAVAGQIDGGMGLASASSQYVTTPSFGPAAAALTMSEWVKGTTFPNDYNSTINRGTASVDSYGIFVKSTGKLYNVVLATAGVSYDGTGSHTLSTGTWYYLVTTYDSVNGLIGYVNAASDGTAAANGTSSTNNISSAVGWQNSTGTRFWNGSINEVRVSSVARSANWITTEYNNQNSPSTFYTLGGENGVSIFPAFILAWS